MVSDMGHQYAKQINAQGLCWGGKTWSPLHICLHCFSLHKNFKKKSDAAAFVSGLYILRKGFYSIKMLKLPYLLQRLLHLKLDLSGFYFHIRSNLDFQIHIFQDYNLIVLPFITSSHPIDLKCHPSPIINSHVTKSNSSFWYFSFRDVSVSPHPLPTAKKKYYSPYFF